MSAKNSQRYKPTAVSEKLVPALFILIMLGLLAVLVVVGLAVLGLTPGA